MSSERERTAAIPEAEEEARDGAALMEAHPPNLPYYRIRVLQPWAPEKVMFMTNFYHDWPNREDRNFFETVDEAERQNQPPSGGKEERHDVDSTTK